MEHMARNCDILTSNYSQKIFLKPAIIKTKYSVLLENKMDWQCCEFTISALDKGYKEFKIQNSRSWIVLTQMKPNNEHWEARPNITTVSKSDKF